MPTRKQHSLKNFLEFKRNMLFDFIFIAVVVIVCTIINVSDLTSWFYSVEGDDWIFFTFAQDNPVTFKNFFVQSGPYGDHPILGSYYQKFFMDLFTSDVFGWRFSSAFIQIISIPFVFCLLKKLGYHSIAPYIATVTFAFSSYFLAYGHTGYNNIHPVLILVAALVFLMPLEQSIHKVKETNLSPITFFIAGLFSGLGWYTFYSGRVVVGFGVLTILLLHKTSRIKKLAVFSIGFLLFFIPFIYVNKSLVISKMISQTSLSEEYTLTEDPKLIFAKNLWLNSTAPVRFAQHQEHHFIGFLFDPINQVGFVLGLGILLINFKRKSWTLLLFYLLTVVIVSLKPLHKIVLSRLHFTMLLAIVISSIGLESTLLKLQTILKIPTKYLNGMVAFFIVMIICINYYQWKFYIPVKYYIPFNEALIVRLIQDYDTSLVIYSGESDNQVLSRIVGEYQDQNQNYFFNDQTTLNFPTVEYFLVNGSVHETSPQWEAAVQQCKNAQKLLITDYSKHKELKYFKCVASKSDRL